ncbi:MAG: uroporphyrinogen-III C-methyltransferase [Cytophagales bacterium]|nr:uroporphyrinogen-III C-methyltransferase [Cytophagales bacterium]
MNVVIQPPSGSVTLVGAGPGDPELLTLKAVRAIASATVILVDDLVNDAVLAHAKKDARIVHVGKRGGCQSTPQAFINKMMIAEYQHGETVVRLKGGDPLIFGRAGEEIAALRTAGIECKIVNGITAGLAAANSVQMPLTHRDWAHGVIFVTGHAQANGEMTNWSLLGHMAKQNKLSLVIYMGLQQAPNIQSGLLNHMSGATPVLLVQAASSANEITALTCLADLTQTLAKSSLASPLVMVIGDVVRAAAVAPDDLVSLVKDGYNTRLVA